MDIEVKKSNNGLKGEFEIPADKSITHRAFMFASLTGSKVEVKNYSLYGIHVTLLFVNVKRGCHGDSLFLVWSWWWGLNPRPADYESAALPTELH